MVRMSSKSAIWLSFFLLSGNVAAQCGMGIPSAGNPNCVPPGMPGSPYVTAPQNNSRQPVYQQPIIIKHEWADRWGAMVADRINPVFGYSQNARSQKEAEQLAIADCESKGGRGCDKVFSYRNQCAVMLAIKEGGGAYYQSAVDLKEAELHGLNMCKKNNKTCRIIHQNCSYAEAVPIR